MRSVHVHEVAPTTGTGSVKPAASTSYAVQLLLDTKPVLVVGGGNVAERKALGLSASGARITVVAPAVRPEVAEIDGVVEVRERPYTAADLAGQWLVITCTDDPAVNAQVAADARARGIWANSADDPANCDFILPSVARRGDITLTASTAGRSPALASWLRRTFEAALDERADRLLDLLAATRAEVRSTRGTSEVSGWNEALDGGVVDLVLAGDDAAARALLRDHLGLPVEPEHELVSPTSAPLASPVAHATERVA